MIAAPWYQNPCETLAFNMYAMNTQKLDELAIEFAAQAMYGIDINNINIQREICKNYEVNFDHLTDFEIDYLKEAIERKLR